MIKKTINYKNDFTGDNEKGDFYFNLSKAEIIKLAAENQGLEEKIKRIAAEENVSELLKVFEEIVGLSYGVRKDNKFIKDAEETKAFLASDAYSELFLSLMKDSVAAADFIKGIIPKDLSETNAVD